MMIPTLETKMILIAAGYEVAVAEDARQGLEKIKVSQPHLVLLDIMMESIFEGFSFLSVLRTAPEYEGFKAVRALMVSSVKTDTGSRFSFTDDEDMGDSPQPDDYLDKPIKPKLLLDKVATLIPK